MGDIKVCTRKVNFVVTGTLLTSLILHKVFFSVLKVSNRKCRVPVWVKLGQLEEVKPALLVLMQLQINAYT